MFSRGRQGGFRAGTGPLLILFAWAGWGCRRWVRRFSGHGLGEFRVVGLRVFVGPRFSRYPGFARSSQVTRGLPVPFARSSQVTRGLPVPFPAVSQVHWGPPFPFPAVSQGAWGPPLPFPAVPSASQGVNHFPSQFNGASRLVGLLRRGEEVHRPEAIASRVRFLRFRSPCECNLLPMGHWPPALNRVGSKG